LKRTPLALAAAAATVLGLRAAGPKSEILVFGAASLTESLQNLGKAYEARTGDKVVLSFGASNDLARQIDAGAPADVFFSADTAKMDSLEKAGLVRAADRREFLSNRLVVVVPKTSTRKIGSPADLVDLPKIALADPTAIPAGVYAKKWLTGLGLWEKIEPRVVPTLDVRAALAAVESEAVPAAIVYSTDASIGKNVRVAFEVNDGPQIVYAVAALANSKNRAQAEAFVQFLAGETGRAEFQRRGFLIRDGQ
jgi:molybdate transport system substrate-binding protein